MLSFTKFSAWPGQTSFNNQPLQIQMLTFSVSVSAGNEDPQFMKQHETTFGTHQQLLLSCKGAVAAAASILLLLLEAWWTA